MSEHTTAELISFIGCDSCSDYVSCDIKDHCRWKACAERLESQEKELEACRKKIYEDTERISKIDELEKEIEKLKWDNAALEATVENQRKQIAETYTAKQFWKDVERKMRFQNEVRNNGLAEVVVDFSRDYFVGMVREWTKYHPEKPKVTNCDKLIEVFGDEASGIVASNSWLKAEYKEPSDK